VKGRGRMLNWYFEKKESVRSWEKREGESEERGGRTRGLGG